MNNNESVNNKKVLTSLVLGVLSLIVLVAGATYAYFAVGVTNNFNTTTINSTTAPVGTVTLNVKNSSLTMDLTAADMMQNNTGSYYATPNGKIKNGNGTLSNNTMAYVSLSGTGVYKCDYTLNISASGTNNMYTAFQNMATKSTNQIMLIIPGNFFFSNTTYDFNTPNLFPITKTGSFYILNENGYDNNSLPVYDNWQEILSFINTQCSEYDINGQDYMDCQDTITLGYLAKILSAKFVIKNDGSIDQTALAGTDITLTFSFPNFSCTAITLAELQSFMQGN